jgi:hypothetical protein
MIDRQTADAKLVRGCVSGIKAFIENPEEDGTSVTGPENVRVVNSYLGRGFREVRIDFTTSDGWYEETREYRCTFQETFGPFNLYHEAVIWLADIGDRYIGNKDGAIVGEMTEHVKLNRAVNEGFLKEE